MLFRHNPLAGDITMLLSSDLLPGRLLRRYKRFLADIELADGRTITAHCPNSGSMTGCAVPGSHVLLSESSKPSRKLPYTWELVQVDGVWVGINTSLTNRLAREGVEIRHSIRTVRLRQHTG